MADHTHQDYPIVSNSAGKIVMTEQALPVDGSGSTLGLGMLPQPGYPRIPGLVTHAKGRGTFDLDEPNVPPNDVRFTRGPRMNGRAGTLDVWFTAPTAGTARTLCYLTDNPVGAGNVIALRIDTSNRPLTTLTSAGGATASTGVLTGTANFGNTETVTIDGKVYTFQSALTDVDGNVFIGADLENSLLNLLRAINLGAGSGSLYAASTTLHSTVSAIASDATTMTVQAKAAGPGGDAITTTEGAANASWGGATLSGGAVGATTVGEVTPSGAAIPAGRTVHVRLSWDSVNLVNGVRYANLVINEEAVDTDWSTDPTTAWTHFQPTHLVLGQGFDTDSDVSDVSTIKLVQGSNLVTL